MQRYLPRRSVTPVRLQRALPLVVLLGLVVLLAAIAYFPFDWDPPRTVSNSATITSNGVLRLGDMNDARTPGTPSWLQEVRVAGVVQIELDVNPRLSQLASVMMLASNFWDTDFAIGQNRSTLLVWLRRPGSDENGDPPFAVGEVFKPGRWTRLNVALARNAIIVKVDGITRLAEPIAVDSPRVWTASEIVLGNEVHAGRSWRGEIRQAEVRTPDQTVDYLKPGALVIPKHFFYLPDHVLPFPPPSLAQWLIVLLHLLSFVPVGFVMAFVRRPLVRPAPVALGAALLALLLAAGTFLFHGRHTAVIYVVVDVIGALLGALLASRLTQSQGDGPHRQAPTPGPQAVQPEST